ncbi:DUF4397 domain-containing protein [Pedobacter frigidisoli]|uniref:DUF4397 domain-containing protein n=1 Tax=Pedobacter frigidisoli TaxID=2530455 RepID=UPI0029311F1A|nr:DUF4397 domain-containing protein [Pedobacter frigidisoli]
MKKLIYLSAFLTIFAMACKKDIAVNPEPLLASLNIVNVATDDFAVYINPFKSEIIYTKQNSQNSPLYLKNSIVYGIRSGSADLKVVSASDTLKTFYSNTVNLEPLKMYSLFIAGNASKRENLLVKDDIIPRYTDSALAVRVINLSSDGPSINLSISGNSLGTNISYKEKSEFKKISLSGSQGRNGLDFDIIDASSGQILTTFNLSQYGYPISSTSARFKAITLVVFGSLSSAPFSTDSYQVFASPNY